MTVGVVEWIKSKTYSLVVFGSIGSFCLDFFKDAGTYGIVIPAGFAAIIGRMARDAKMATAEPEDES